MKVVHIQLLQIIILIPYTQQNKLILLENNKIAQGKRQTKVHQKKQKSETKTNKFNNMQHCQTPRPNRNVIELSPYN